MASKLKKSRGIEELKARWGFMFISPWLVGLIIFFFIPIVQSIIYSFSSVNAIGEWLGWKGFEHYDSFINLAHGKGHAMGGFGANLKNQSIQ